MMKINMKPRLWARMIRVNGCQVTNPNKKLVQPTKFGAQRAEEIKRKAKENTCGPWSDNMKEHMTDGEIVYVLAVWDQLPGNASFISAFNLIKGNHVLNSF